MHSLLEYIIPAVRSYTGEYGIDLKGMVVNVKKLVADSLDTHTTLSNSCKGKVALVLV